MSKPRKDDTELNELESDLMEAAEAVLAYSLGELNLPAHDYHVSDKGVLEKASYED